MHWQQPSGLSENMQLDNVIQAKQFLSVCSHFLARRSAPVNGQFGLMPASHIVCVQMRLVCPDI